MPRLEDLKLGVSPITERVYVGTVSKKDAGLWLQKRDATSTFCAALLTWAPPGTIREIRSSSGEYFEVEVRKIDPPAADQSNGDAHAKT